MRALKHFVLAGLLALGFAAPGFADAPQPTSDRNIIASCTAACDIPLKTAGLESIAFSATGSGAGLTFSVQGLQADGATWVTLPVYNEGTQTSTLSALSANGSWIVSSGGYLQVRAHLTVIGGGTETFALNGSAGGHAVVITAMPGVTITNPTVGAAVPATANYIAANKAGTLTGVTLDGSSNLNVNCAAGCSSTSDTSVTGSVSSAAVLFTQDASGFNSISFGFTSVGAGNTVKVQQNNDNGATWFDVPITNTTAGTAAAVNGITPATGTQYTAPVTMRYARLNVTTYGSGTVTAQGSLKGGNYPNFITLGTGANVVGALTANQSVNAAQFGGTNVSTGTGAGGAGIPRVTISNDSSLAANQSVNAAQINGVTPLMGNGVTGTGSPRVTIASDNTSNSNPWLVNGNVTPADAAALGTTSLRTYSAGGLYNGATIDFAREVANSANTVGTGITAVGLMEQCDNTTPTSLTENSFGNIRMSCDTHALLAGAAYNSTPASRTDGNPGQLESDLKGSLRMVQMSADTVTPISSNTFADGASMGTGLSVRNVNMLFNTSTYDRQLGVANSTNSTGTGIVAVGDLGQCDDTSPTAITENSFGNNRIDCATHAHVATLVPSATAGGTTLFTLTAANSTNATNVKASAGQVYGLSGYTISATAAWLSLYNNSGTPTCGTSIIQQYLIPGSASGAGFNIEFTVPKGFATGIAFCLTTGIAGTGSVAASSYVVNVDYK